MGAQPPAFSSEPSFSPEMIDPATGLPVALDWEKKGGAAIHLVSIVAPFWVAGLTWLLLRGKSRFVAAHAFQELLDGVTWKLISWIISGGLLIWSLSSLVQLIQTRGESFDWRMLALRVAIALTVGLAIFIYNAVSSLRQASRAFKGQWPSRVEKKARRRTAGQA